MAYTPIQWKDYPNEETPINAVNLNHMDNQIKANADAIAALPTIPTNLAYIDTTATGSEVDLQNKDGENISPKTTTSAVYDEDGNSVADLIGTVPEGTNIEEQIITINNSLSAINNNPQDFYTSLKKKVHIGRNLGTSFTSAQSQAIRDGSFTGMGIGDYWVINGHAWRIWDIDWYLNKGDSQCTTHHLVIMPDDNLLDANGSDTHYMNDTNTTAGGYAGTKYRSTYRSQCESAVNSAFGSGHILGHRELMCTEVSNGKASSWAWQDATVEIPSEVMMYGATIWSNYTDGGSGYNVGTAYPQLELAHLDASRVINRKNYWLRDVVSASWFADVDYHGVASCYVAGYPWVGVRPYFLLY